MGTHNNRRESHTIFIALPSRRLHSEVSGFLVWVVEVVIIYVNVK